MRIFRAFLSALLAAGVILFMVWAVLGYLDQRYDFTIACSAMGVGLTNTLGLIWR